MNSKQLINALIKSNFVQAEIPMQMEMGLPLLKKTEKGVAIGFRPYKQVRKENILEIYSPRFEVEWVYPFNHVSYFKNLGVYSKEIDNNPICKLDDETMLSIGLQSINELYNELDAVLYHLEDFKTVSDIAIEKYQNAFRKTVEQLGLEKLYFGNE